MNLKSTAANGLNVQINNKVINGILVGKLDLA